tara:strand:- start:5205 stop:6131 length:927 start_codon:yes stop_codon:yes gene_type:complete
MAAVTSAVIGIVVAGASMTASLTAKAKAKRKEEEALAKSDELMDDARKKAEINYMEGLSVPLDAYGEEYKQNLQSQKQIIDSLAEGDSRNIAAGVGRVAAAGLEANEETRIGMGEELFALDKLQAKERSRINQDLKDMDVGQAADRQMISRDAAAAKAYATQGMISSAGMMLKSGASLVPLYTGNGSDNRLDDVLTQGGSGTDGSAAPPLGPQTAADANPVNSTSIVGRPGGIYNSPSSGTITDVTSGLAPDGPIVTNGNTTLTAQTITPEIRSAWDNLSPQQQRSIRNSGLGLQIDAFGQIVIPRKI